MSMVETVAVLVDVAFFLKRFRKVYPQQDVRNPEEVGKALYAMCMKHVADARLHRILVYDCPPLDKRSHHPITKESVDFSNIPSARFRQQLHAYLKRQRKVALRLGYLAAYQWRIKPQATKKILSGAITVNDLAHNDVEYDITQKGVDMKLGVDIAALALKRQVDQIILISGDGDFVPASKLARREGIDVVLDPMWATIGESLNEHVDGIKSTSPKPTAPS